MIGTVLVLLAACVDKDSSQAKTPKASARKPAPVTEQVQPAEKAQPVAEKAKLEAKAEPVQARAAAEPAEDELPAVPDLDFTGWTTYDVERIVDGDTIVVEHSSRELYTIRLIGVDTPETKHPNKPVEELGAEATAFITELLDGEQVYLEPDQGDQIDADRYGRYLAHVWRVRDGYYINLAIISWGYSYAYTKYPFREERMELFRAYADDARENNLGLWALKAADTSTSTTSAGSDILVYHVGEGKRYHRATCHHVSGKSGVTEHTLAEAKRLGYTPCKVCDPPE